MSRSIKRKISVLDKEYTWVLNGNSIDGEKEHHIRVHVGKQTKSILYIDPYPWEMEIRPKLIQQAILYALSQEWQSKVSKSPLYISMKNDAFYVLSKGIKYGYQNK